jgi:peptide/nickel transport system substrate-binding protein
MLRNARSRLTRRSLLRVAAGSAVAAQTAALAPMRSCAQGATPEAPIQGGMMTYGSGTPVQNIFNPLNTFSTSQNVIIEAVWQRLVYGRQWGPDLNPQADGPIELGVASAMTEVEKDRVWDFEIRDNATWHDGTPITADDVIFGIWLSLNKFAGANNETPVIGIKGGERLLSEGSEEVSVEGAKKLGERALRIELEEPYPNYWVDWSIGYWPIPQHIYGAIPLDKIFDDPELNTMPVGNGPFKVSNFVDGQYIEMVANDDFYLGRPILDTYVIRFGDPDTLAAALEAGEIDGMGLSAGAVYDRITQLPYIVGNAVRRDHPEGFHANFVQVPEAATLHKAIMHAIDVPTINAQLFNSTLKPSNYLFEHVVGLEQPPAGFPTYTYDPEQARAILAEIGWDSNRELRWVEEGDPGPLEDAMVAMLAAVGLKLTYQLIDPARYIQDVQQGTDWDIAFGNMGPDQKMQSNWRYIKCGWDWDNGGLNSTRYCDEEVDALWEEALSEQDPELRKDLFDQVSLRLADNPPHATLWRRSSLYAWNRRVQGAYPYQYRLPVRPPFERVWIAE